MADCPAKDNICTCGVKGHLTPVCLRKGKPKKSDAADKSEETPVETKDEASSFLSATCFGISAGPKQKISEAPLNSLDDPRPLTNLLKVKQAHAQTLTDVLVLDNIFSTSGVPDHIYSPPRVLDNSKQANNTRFPLQPRPSIPNGQDPPGASHLQPEPPYMSPTSLTKPPPALRIKDKLPQDLGPGSMSPPTCLAGGRPSPTPGVAWGELSPSTSLAPAVWSAETSPSYMQTHGMPVDSSRPSLKNTNRDSKMVALTPRKNGVAQVSSSCTPVMPSSVQTPVLDEPEVSTPGRA